MSFRHIRFVMPAFRIRICQIENGVLVSNTKSRYMNTCFSLCIWWRINQESINKNNQKISRTVIGLFSKLYHKKIEKCKPFLEFFYFWTGMQCNRSDHPSNYHNGVTVLFKILFLLCCWSLFPSLVFDQHFVFRPGR